MRLVNYREAVAAVLVACCLQLLSLFLPLRRAVQLLSQYKCREALAALAQLPAQQLGSPGVLLLIGRCHYELVDYVRAADAFEAARAADPLNLEVRAMRVGTVVSTVACLRPMLPVATRNLHLANQPSRARPL